MQCPHCQADLSANPAAGSCPACGRPVPPSLSRARPVVGQLTAAGIVMTLIWVLVVNYIEHCRGTRAVEELRRRGAQNLQPYKDPSERP
jgi:hypothetical protein